MLDRLFSSRVRAKTLIKIFLSPGIAFNAWEMAQQLSENYSAVWKELNRLEKLGILRSEKKGNAKAYSADPTCPILSELRSIVLKTEGISSILREKLNGLGVKEAFIFGSYASGNADQHSDLDLMIIGEVDLTEFSDVISTLEDELSRPINYVFYPEEGWKTKIADQDPFVVNVLNAPRIMLIGDEHGS